MMTRRLLRWPAIRSRRNWLVFSTPYFLLLSTHPSFLLFRSVCMCVGERARASYFNYMRVKLNVVAIIYKKHVPAQEKKALGYRDTVNNKHYSRKVVIYVTRKTSETLMSKQYPAICLLFCPPRNKIVKLLRWILGWFPCPSPLPSLALNSISALPRNTSHL